MVADSLAKQEEEGILCSPISQIENVNEEEMDTSISHYKRKVRGQPRLRPQPEPLVFTLPLCPDNERLRLSEAAGERNVREGHPGEGEGQRHLLRHEDPEEGGHHRQGSRHSCGALSTFFQLLAPNGDPTLFSVRRRTRWLTRSRRAGF